MLQSMIRWSRPLASSRMAERAARISSSPFSSGWTSYSLLFKRMAGSSAIRPYSLRLSPSGSLPARGMSRPSTSFTMAGMAASSMWVKEYSP